MGQENGIENGHSDNNGPKSGLARIEFAGNNPFELFKEWHHEAKNSELVNPDAFCFTTCSEDGTPSSRHMLLRRLDHDGFVMMTDNRSRKSKEIAENPKGCMAFLWVYRRDGKVITRQVRMAGRVEDLHQSDCQEIWDREPLFCKIRAYICDQGAPVDWDEQKERHDDLYKEFVKKIQLPAKPNHVTFYKLKPHFMDFYDASDNCISDRLAFHGLDRDGKLWKMERIAA